jgi:hypothetical protein
MPLRRELVEATIDVPFDRHHFRAGIRRTPGGVGRTQHREAPNYAASITRKALASRAEVAGGGRSQASGPKSAQDHLQVPATSLSVPNLLGQGGHHTEQLDRFDVATDDTALLRATEQL